MTCWASLSAGDELRCERCALPLPDQASTDGPARGCCLRCVLRPFPFDRAVAAVGYDEQARRFLLRAKNGNRPEVLRPLAGQLATVVAHSGIAEGVDGVVCVPSSARACWRRGFNPAHELARELSRASGVPLLGNVLGRRGLGGSQAKGLGAPARWSGAGRSFVPRRTIKGAKVLLVDDVLTTGATASACAVALRSAGAAEVRVAIWARTPAPAFGFDRRCGRRL